MDDFSSAGILWLVVILTIGTCLIIGAEYAKNDIVDQCSNFSGMYVGNNVYECKLIKKIS